MDNCRVCCDVIANEYNVAFPGRIEDIVLACDTGSSGGLMNVS